MTGSGPLPGKDQTRPASCDECGGPVDPDISHVQHVDGCPNAERVTFSGPDMAERARAWLQAQEDEDDCLCPEVCAACCRECQS